MILSMPQAFSLWPSSTHLPRIRWGPSVLSHVNIQWLPTVFRMKSKYLGTTYRALDLQSPSLCGSCFSLHSHFLPLFPAPHSSSPNDLVSGLLKILAQKLSLSSSYTKPCTSGPANLAGLSLAVTSSQAMSWFLLQEELERSVKLIYSTLTNTRQKSLFYFFNLQGNQPTFQPMIISHNSQMTFATILACFLTLFSRVTL